jgi:hypothetical protein
MRQRHNDMRHTLALSGSGLSARLAGEQLRDAANGAAVLGHVLGKGHGLEANGAVHEGIQLQRVVRIDL